MLSICFCYERCCDVRLMLRDGPNRYWDEYNHRLPGVQVLVSQACTPAAPAFPPATAATE